MAIELEQEFYDTFRIEPKCYNPIVYLSEDKKCKCVCQKCEQYKYPNITAEKLLQLLCIVIDEYNRNGRTFYLDSTDVKELKEEILDALMGCIDASCDLFEPEVKKIQQLFKEA